MSDREPMQVAVYDDHGRLIRHIAAARMKVIRSETNEHGVRVTTFQVSRADWEPTDMGGDQ